jgi:O-antigen ligase
MRVPKISQTVRFITDLQFFEILNRSIPVLIGILIFFNPFPHTTSIKEACFYLSASIALFLIVSRSGRFSFKTPLLLPFCLFVLWAFVGIFFALDKENSMHDFYSHLLRYIILYFITINFFNSKRLFEALSWIMVVSATIFSIGAMVYFYVILGHNLSERLANFDQIPCNRISMLAAFGVLISLHLLFTKIQWVRRATLLFFMIPLLAAIILTQTRGTVVAMFLALIMMFFRYRKMMVAFLGGMLIIVAITPIKDRLFDTKTNYPRMGTNYLSFEIIKDYPISGIGFGMQTYGRSYLLSPEAYMSRIPAEYWSHEFFRDPHNMLFGIAVRTGLVGLAFFLYIISVFAYMCWKLTVNGKGDFIRGWGLCMLSTFFFLFVVGLFEPVFNHLTETLLFTIFSMATVLWRMHENGDREIIAAARKQVMP